MKASTVSNNSSVISRSSAYTRHEEPLLSPKAFIVKPSPKKLTIDPSTLSTLFRNRSTTVNGSPSSTPPPVRKNSAINRTESVFDPDAESSAQNVFSKTSHAPSRSSGQIHDLTNAPKQTSSMKSPTSSKTVPLTSGSNQQASNENENNSSDRALMEDEVVIRSKVGYGQIEFRETVDLSGIENFSKDLLGEIIVFKQSLCSVYPDDPIDKPPVGKGLNVPAVITLDNCWTIDKATRMPIKDPNHARVKLFTKRLMKSEDIEFIEYDAQAGKWTFAVEHFTTYGIDDSDEGSDEDEGTGSYIGSESQDDRSGSDHRPSRRVRQPRESGSNTNVNSDENEDDGPPQAMLFEDEQEGMSLDKEHIPGTAGQMINDRSEDETTASVTGSDDLEGPFPSKQVSKKRPRQAVSSENSVDNDKVNKQGSSSDWRNQIGLESRKVAVMQASLFARPDSSRSQVKLTPKAPSKNQDAHLQVPQRARAASRQAPLQTKEPLKKKHQRGRHVQIPKVYPFLTIFSFWEINSNKTPSLSMARSFRVSWIGQSHQVIHPARGEIGNMLDTSNLQHTSFSHLAVSTIPSCAFEIPTEMKSAVRLLEIQFKHTAIRLEEGVPSVMTNPKLRFRDFQASYEKSDRANDANELSGFRREDGFTRWLEKTVAPSVEQDVRLPSRQQSKFSGIFQLLTGNQIERACELAIQLGNYRLATLISQCKRSDPTFKTDMVQQNLIWRQLRVDAHLDRDLRKTYELISGNVTVSKGSGKKSEGLDWKRALGLHFWFLGSDNNFWVAIKTYEEAFKRDRCGPPPIPWYMDSNGNKSKPTILIDLPNIKIFVDPTHSLESVLEPRGFGPSPFDYRMPWHLYILIAKVMRLRDFEDRAPIMRDIEIDSDSESDDGDHNGINESGSVWADLLTTQYADQLTKLGLIKWSGFVLLHLENPIGRERALKELISRNINSVTDEVEDFFVKRLKIPSTWINLARAQVAHYEGHYYEEYKLLFKSFKISEAHKIVILELAPDAVLRGDLKMIKKLFCGNSNQISSSDLTGGAKVFMDFVKVIEGLQYLNGSTSMSTGRGKRNLDDHPSLENREEIEEMLASKVSNLIQEIPFIFNEFTKRNGLTVKQQVCINEMMSSLMNLMEHDPRTITNHYQQERRTDGKDQSDYTAITNLLINMKDLKISDQVLFIQNSTHKSFLKTLQRFPPALVHSAPISV
ncbi:hypothetical protein KEM48_011465 [Puccinia striiformis f. sp. tritici PST-130]|nr:hypothetical protein KEM48_011465 [Puccinia striiformis f. sp. tritici PST-130]